VDVALDYKEEVRIVDHTSLTKLIYNMI